METVDLEKKCPRDLLHFEEMRHFFRLAEAPTNVLTLLKRKVAVHIMGLISEKLFWVSEIVHIFPIYYQL